jgi:hypothetical protein
MASIITFTCCSKWNQLNGQTLIPPFFLFSDCKPVLSSSAVFEIVAASKPTYARSLATVFELSTVIDHQTSEHSTPFVASGF